VDAGPHDLLIWPEKITGDLNAPNDALGNVGDKRISILPECDLTESIFDSAAPFGG